LAVANANPLRAGLRLARVPEPSVMVIFGGTGDLSTRKLLPALYDLARQRLLPAAFAIVGIGRGEMTDAEYRAQLREAVAEHSRSRPLDEEVWASFAERLLYVSVRSEDGYGDLRRRLDRIDSELGTCGNRLFYLATPPGAYAPIVRSLGRADLARSGNGWARIVVEKPFGRDLETARALTETLHEVFKEEEVFRIDHYLGKETVQNILVLRFANAIFEPIWSRWSRRPRSKRARCATRRSRSSAPSARSAPRRWLSAPCAASTPRGSSKATPSPDIARVARSRPSRARRPSSL